MTSAEILNIALAVCVAIALAAFLWAHRAGGRYEHFHLLDLITTTNGRIDRPALMEFTVFALMCWGFVIFVLRDKLPEWFLTMFVGAFVLRSAYSAWLRSSGDRSSARTGDHQQPRIRPIPDDKDLPPVPRPRDMGE